MQGFTKLDNSILFNSSLSAQAKILYAQFFHYSTIPNFVIRKCTIMKASGMAKNTFEKYMRELKSFGLIELKETRIGNKYEYEYIVNTEVSCNTQATKANNQLTKATQLVKNVIKELKGNALTSNATSKAKQQAEVYVTPSATPNTIPKYNRTKTHKSNKYFDYPQRQYTKQDYSNLEQMLLQRSYLGA